MLVGAAMFTVCMRIHRYSCMFDLPIGGNGCQCRIDKVLFLLVIYRHRHEALPPEKQGCVTLPGTESSCCGCSLVCCLVKWCNLSKNHLNME